MTSHLFGKSGIPALACSTPDGAPLSLCTLFVTHSPDNQQATVLLQFPILGPGSNQQQSFTLRYDADNLVSGTTALKNPTLFPPQALLSQIARQGSPRIKTLFLALKHPCSVWYPLSAASVAPKDTCQHVDIANAKEVHILFDYNWLHRDKHACFQSIFSHPDELTGVPIVDDFAKSHRQVDWTISEVVHEAPPPYCASSKHERQVSTSPAPESRSSKRKCQALLPFPSLSPTEKATTPSIPSPQSPSSPIINVPGFQEAVERALKKGLRGAMSEWVPTVSPHSSAVSPSTSSRPTSSLEASCLNTLICAHITTQLRNIHAEAASDAADLRSAANAEFHEQLDEHKLDVTMARDDAIAELNRVYDDTLDKLRESAANIVDEVNECLNKLHADARDKADGPVRGDTLSLKHDMAVLAIERQILEKDKAVLANRGAILEKEKAILQKEKAILEIKKAILEEKEQEK